MKITGKFLHLLLFPLYTSPVQNNAAQTCVSSFTESRYGQTYIGSRVDGHILAGSEDIYLIRVAVPHGHGETAADHIAQDVVEDHVGIIPVQDPFIPESLQCRDDPSACASATGERSAGLGAEDPSSVFCVLNIYDIIQREGFPASHLFHDGRQRMPFPERDRGIRFGVAADLQNGQSFAGPVLRQIGDGCGFADAAFSVKCDSDHVLCAPVITLE